MKKRKKKHAFGYIWIGYYYICIILFLVFERYRRVVMRSFAVTTTNYF